MDEDGNISNITPEVSKWTLQSNDIRIEATSCTLKHTTILRRPLIELQIFSQCLLSFGAQITA